MTEINKANLISNLNTIISSLNLSTASENRLSLIYKAAVNDGETPTSIIAELESRIEAVSTLSSIEKSLLYSLVTSLLTEDRSIVIANLTALNALTNISVGSVYYVESEGFPYIKKTDGSWTRIDPANQSNLLPNAWSWGVGTAGVLGDGTIVAKSSPISVTGGFTDWVQVSSGQHSLGLRSNGTAWAWGPNDTGQLGDNTTVSKSSPVSIVGGFTDWTQLSAGLIHSLGLSASGIAWGWGYNTPGTLGDNSTTNRSSPVSVVGGVIDWIQLSAGNQHSLGLRANGTAWAWGSNANGGLGDNTTTSRLSPVSVVGGFTDWTQLSAGNQHSLGLRANGTAWGWGLNGYGQLGNDGFTDRSSPVSVVGGFTNWTQLSAGSRGHSLGLRANGTAWAWGVNTSGRLGDGTTTTAYSPTSIVGGFTDWVKLSTGYNHSAGLRANGTTWAWGNNIHGQLGDNTTVAKSSPVSVIGGFTDWVDVSVGRNITIGIRGSNSVSG